VTASDAGGYQRLDRRHQAKGDMKSTTGKHTISDGIAPGSGDDAAALILNDQGMICDCNLASEMLFKYRRGELVWRPVSMLLPQLLEVDLLENGEPNPHLRFLCHIGRQFEVVAQDGERFACELFLNFLGSAEHRRLSLIVRPVKTATTVCRGKPQTESPQRTLRHIAA
jgi:hypothetical protein